MIGNVRRADSSADAGKRVRLTPGELSFFAGRMAELLEADFGVAESLTALRGQLKDSRLKTVVARAAGEVYQGGNLSDALEDITTVPTVCLAMIRAGEGIGRMDAVFKELAGMLEEEEALRQQILTSLLYPAIVLVAGVISFLVLFVWVVPAIVPMFEDLGQELPLITRVMIGISRGLTAYGWVAAAVTAVAVFLGVYYLRKPEIRRRWEDLYLRTPVVGSFVRLRFLVFFCKTVKTMLSAGVPAPEAIRASIGAAGHAALRSKAEEALYGIVAGEPMSTIFAPGYLDDPLAFSLLSNAEYRGNPAGGFGHAADIYERKIRRRLRVLSALAEPVLILGLGVGIGLVVLAVLLPLMNLNIAV